jgi:hypothetical protein
VWDKALIRNLVKNEKDLDMLDINVVLIFLAAWLYYEGLRRVDRYWANLKPLSDEEYLTQMARRCQTSEYELFRRAAKVWQVSRARVEADFKRYLLGGHLPHYMTDFIRKSRKKRDQTEASSRPTMQETTR